MACELVGAKMVAPFFGTSLYVWASVLGVTLGGLMCGYYLGGWLTGRFKTPQLLYWVLVGAAGFLLLMPFTGSWIMEQTLGLGVRAGSIVSLLLFMFPALIFMGMTSPVIIRDLNEAADTAGKTAGSVYAISTLGGIVATFLVGFYLVPEIGLTRTALGYATILGLPPTVSLVRARAWAAAALPAAVVAALASLGGSTPHPHLTVVWESEGILGQIKVVDRVIPRADGTVLRNRALLVNNMTQTIVDLDDVRHSAWVHSFYFPVVAGVRPAGSRALVLGLGGGTIVHQLTDLGFELDVVELDPRIRDAAIEWFGVPAETRITIDDGRHFIRTASSGATGPPPQYEVVIYDTFQSETPPAHLLTREAFAELDRILAPEGVVLINFYGFTTGELGRAAASIRATLVAAGLAVDLLATPGVEAGRNLIIVAGRVRHDYGATRYAGAEVPAGWSPDAHRVDPSTLPLDVEVLTDERPNLAHLYADAALLWRSDATYTTREFLSAGLAGFE